MRQIGKILLGLLFSLGLIVQASGQSSDDELLRRAAVIKPRPDELKWQKIPWVLDLAEGQRIAQTDHRPIFLWAIADSPLERV